MPAAGFSEAVNDRGKLLYHRLIARELRRRPELRDEAKAIIREWQNEGHQQTFIARWAALLDLDIDALAARLVARSGDMNELRSTSPFVKLPRLVISDTSIRRRVWRLAKKGLVNPIGPSRTLSAP